MKLVICLLFAVFVAAANAGCCVPQQWDGHIGYSLTYGTGGDDFNMVNSQMGLSYDADNGQVFAEYNGMWPLLPGVQSSLAHFNTKQFWLVYEDGTCLTGTFEPNPYAFPLCIPDDAPGVNFWMGFDIAVKSYDVAQGSPNVRSYVTVKEPSCFYLVTWTAWKNMFVGSDISATLTMSMMNQTLGIANPNIFNPPDCQTSNENLDSHIQQIGPFPGVFKN